MNACVVDVFCGIGGLSYGFRQEGFTVSAGVDSDTSCEYAFRENIGGEFVPEDIREMSDQRLIALFPAERTGPRVLIGCAPCQPFSTYTRRYRKKGSQVGGQWKLLDDFTRVIALTDPDVVSMENVTRVRKHSVFERFVASLRERGYSVTNKLVKAHHYGVPQKRTRLVLLASKYGPIDLVPPTHKHAPRTVEDAISHLLPIIAGGPSPPGDRLHRARGLSPKNLERIRAATPGGFWREWDNSLKLACHLKKGGESFRSVYGRMVWEAPSPVITTQCLGVGNGRFGHPSQDRAISIREAALLQSFPMKFKFVPPRAPVYGMQLARQIGNAVPVRLARVIARSIKRHLRSASIT